MCCSGTNLQILRRLVSLKLQKIIWFHFYYHDHVKKFLFLLFTRNDDPTFNFTNLNSSISSENWVAFWLDMQCKQDKLTMVLSMRKINYFLLLKFKRISCLCIAFFFFFFWEEWIFYIKSEKTEEGSKKILYLCHGFYVRWILHGT